MKNLKLLSLFSIAIIALLSFKNFTVINQVKDGTYDAYYSVTEKKEGTSFFGTIDQDKKVIIKVQNNVIIEFNNKRSNHPLINQPLQIEKNGDAVSEITDVLQPVGTTDEPRYHRTHKIKIKKEDLIK